MNNLNDLARSCFAFWRPPEKLTLSQWADKQFYLSPESAAEPGKWRTYSYQREPMDAFTDPAVERITLMKSARVGYTKMISCAVGFHIDHDPCSQLIVQPTIMDANGYSKDEIQTMLRDVPCLRGKVAEAKSRDASNTILKKYYPGGVLNIIGANAATGFRRLTVRVVFFDEVDGYPATAGQEGDQISLGIKRTENFWNALAALGSTPTVKGESRIETSFNEGDQRYYKIPCPICGHKQRLQFKNMKWPEGNPERAYFICEYCKKEIDHSKKRSIVDAGEWFATKEFNGHASFHVWAAYSFNPKATWGLIAKRFADASHYFKNTGDDSKLRTVINTDFGETYARKGEGVDSITLIEENRYDTDDEKAIPDEVQIVTAGVDIQHDRIELEIVGWAGLDNFTNWSLDYLVLQGDPLKKEVWKNLDKELKRTFKNENGDKKSVHCVAVDSGDRPQLVYDFVEMRQKNRVFAVKGSSKDKQPVAGRPTNQGIRKNIKLYPVGTDTAKDQIFAQLELAPGENGYCHFPFKYGQEYFDQLTAEKRFDVYKKGVKKSVYKKVNKKGEISDNTRNEALDCRVYALTALYILRSMMKRSKKTIRVVHNGIQK